MKKVILPLMIGIILLTGCRSLKEDVAKQEYKRVTLFCDVEFWGAPLWDSTGDTITGEISRETGATVEVIDAVEDADKQLSMMLVKNNLPDIISVTDETVISQLVTSGKVWSLDTFLETYKPDSHILKDFPEDIKHELIKRDGGWYVWPSHMSSPDNREDLQISDYYLNEIEYSWPMVIMWNKDLLAELNLDDSQLQSKEKIFEAFEKAEQLTASDGKEITPLLVDGENYKTCTLEFLRCTFGAERIDENGNSKDEFLQPEMKEALEFLNKTIRNGYMTADQLMLSNSQIKPLLDSGQVLCFIGNYSNTGVNPEGWLSSGVILSDSGAHPVYEQKLRRSTGWIQTFISKECENPEVVADFFDYMTSEEGQLKWVFGEEGVHYNYNEDGLIEITEEGYEAQGNYKESGINTWWMFFNLDWSKSVIAPPKLSTGETLDNNITCAFALNDNTRCIDATALQNVNAIYQGDTEYEQREVQINQWKEKQVKQIILAETDQAFEEEYAKLISGLEERQIEKLDSKKNVEYQKNCQEYEVFIEKVN